LALSKHEISIGLGTNFKLAFGKHGIRSTTLVIKQKKDNKANTERQREREYDLRHRVVVDWRE